MGRFEERSMGNKTGADTGVHSPEGHSTTRREFVKQSAVAAAALAVGGAGPLATRARADEPVKAEPTKTGGGGKPAKTLLILGGTAFLGPEVVEAAKAKGWTITLFNRGKTRPNLFPDLEKLHGDRDPDKGEGLKPLAGRKWDAVVDTSGYYPRMVKASTELLAPSVKQYVFISTLSVYKDNSKVDLDESDELGTIADPSVETMGDQMQNYGPLKALCEQAAEKAMPGRVTNLRPGYIVGPGDWSGRFNYWPLRLRDAKEKSDVVLAPGTPDDAVQMVDVRDLAEFIVLCLDRATTGVMNVTGPKERLRWGDCLEACKRVTKSPASFEWVDWSFIEQNQQPGDYFPICLPPTGETAGFHRRSNKKAVAAGLAFRSVDQTVEGLLAWYDALTQEQKDRFRTGTSRAREEALLKAWAESKAKGNG